MIDVFTRKVKNGWMAYDRAGNTATAATKDMAVQLYNELYLDKKDTNVYEKPMHERIIP